MATKNGAHGNPLVPMAVDLMAPMVHPNAIGTNNNHHFVVMCLPQLPMYHHSLQWIVIGIIFTIDTIIALVATGVIVAIDTIV